MSTASIPLAKSYKPEKLNFPVYFSEKLDGVPVRIDVAPDGKGDFTWGTQSRSGEPLPSVDKLVEDFFTYIMSAWGWECKLPMTLVAEITHKTFTNFKDISGVVRRKVPQDDLVLNFFDMVVHADDWRDMPFSQRQKYLHFIATDGHADFKVCKQVKCADKSALGAAITLLPAKAEGGVARSHDAQWKPNSRHWDYQKVVFDPTCDLKIVGFEEAKSAAGEPLNMVGRVLADYHGTEIGVGPGKLTHAERKELWAEWVHWQGAIASGYKDTPWSMIATIQYKRDDSYAALRQPTFQHWRPEKTEPSYN